jgi:hypothetical protein
MTQARVDQRLVGWSRDQALTEAARLEASPSLKLPIPQGTHDYTVEVLRGEELEAGEQPGAWTDPGEALLAWYDLNRP